MPAAPHQIAGQGRDTAEGVHAVDIRTGNERHLGRRHDHFAIKISQQPFTARLGAIDANDAKMLRSNLLNPSMNTAPGLL